MSTRKSSPKRQGKNKKERLAEKSMSFHGRLAEDMVVKLIRPRTVPNLVTGRVAVTTETMPLPKLTKLLLNVTVQRSLGPVQVLISPESTVGDLIAAALRQYSKEGRRPILPSLDPSGFHLHYSQFSLESLAPEETLNELGSRNFFLCPKQASSIAGNNGGHGEIGVGYGGMTTSTPPSSSCSNEADKVTKGGAGWLRFMEFML
ncbi:uncharacterized protein LOC112521234 [Cynara cardunculus var. scolymus]|uniref:DUF7054 domain-containing protein n=1 Tax=Cynara cardunculus var. scolymus TaxID=59895 RepID=A0A103XH95_CYNCS|nr:uncharacterized protein LOC112521234 [Cynara cardunculus var. scolymus]KVH90647.1 hypothetical protein Ccrd_007278 [Cynara cardunculus var. scolymus]